jgi:hypothetical protein
MKLGKLLPLLAVCLAWPWLASTAQAETVAITFDPLEEPGTEFVGLTYYAESGFEFYPGLQLPNAMMYAQQDGDDYPGSAALTTDFGGMNISVNHDFGAAFDVTSITIYNRVDSAIEVDLSGIDGDANTVETTLQVQAGPGRQDFVLPDFTDIIRLTMHGGAEPFIEGYFFDNIVIDFTATPSEAQSLGEVKADYR